jgi:hypothetical protein
MAPAKTVSRRGFSQSPFTLFDADGERRVSTNHPVWFRNGGRAERGQTTAKGGINRKFTPNRIRSLFCKFSHI